MPRPPLSPAVLALNLPDGITKPYRPKPRDFRAVYVSMGWDGITEHYNTNWRIIVRWIAEEGAEELKAERRAFVLEQQGQRRREKAKRYVMGRTLTAVNRGKREG